MVGKSVARARRARYIPLAGVPPIRDICLELTDHSTKSHSAVKLFGAGGSSDPRAQSARLAEQFIEQNRKSWDLLQVTVRRDYDGRDVVLVMESKAAIGA